MRPSYLFTFIFVCFVMSACSTANQEMPSVAPPMQAPTESIVAEQNSTSLPTSPANSTTSTIATPSTNNTVNYSVNNASFSINGSPDTSNETTAVLLKLTPIDDDNSSSEPERPQLFTGAVDVTVRIGAFRTRQTFQEGEGLQVGNRSLIVVFIGEGSDEPEVLFQLDDETVSLGQKEETYLDDAWLYVHEVYFRNRALS